MPSRTRARAPTRWRVWFLLGVIALGVVTGRVLFDARAALLAGQAALGRADSTQAVRELQHAVRMYVPGSPYGTRALAGLEALANAAAAAGDGGLERRSLEAMRAGILGARSLYTPWAAELASVDERLALLYARIEDPAVAGAAALSERQRFYRERLHRRAGASVPATLMALAGFGVWLGAAVLFTRRGLDRTLALRRGWALACGLAFVAGLTLFVAGLRLA